jgi:hypothetical protein
MILPIIKELYHDMTMLDDDGVVVVPFDHQRYSKKASAYHPSRCCYLKLLIITMECRGGPARVHIHYTEGCNQKCAHWKKRGYYRKR